MRCGRLGKVMLFDDAVSLLPRSYGKNIPEMDGADSFTFDILMPNSDIVMGEIALRVGDNESIYYVGHVGYHIDPPYRGNRLAWHACKLCMPVLQCLGQERIVITTDEDNYASIRTCERLGCKLEGVVDVPKWCQERFEISQRKCRYLYP